MKSIISLIAFLALVSSQNPIPVPGLSLSDFHGKWNVVWFYPTQPSEISCWEWIINSDEDNKVENITEIFSVSGRLNTNYLLMNVSTPSQWTTTQGAGFDWVAFDPISGSWAVSANPNGQAAFVVSRNATISNLILNAQILLLQKEGYSVNSQNAGTINNSGCPS